MGSIAALDEGCGALGVQLGDEVNTLVHQAAENSRVGGSPWLQLSGKDPQCPTARALKRVRELLVDLAVRDDNIARQLVLMLARKNELLQTARRDVKYRAWLDVWLLLHIPMTVGLLVALSAHVISVFFYW